MKKLIPNQSNKHAEIKEAQADFTKKFCAELLASGLWFAGAYAARSVAISSLALTLPIVGTIGAPAAFCLLMASRTLFSRYVENMRVKGDHNDITLGEGKPYEAAVGVAFGVLAYFVRSGLLFWPSVFLAVVGIGKSLMKRGETKVLELRHYWDGGDVKERKLTEEDLALNTKKKCIHAIRNMYFSYKEPNNVERLTYKEFQNIFGENQTSIFFSQATGACLDRNTGLVFHIVKEIKANNETVINVCFLGLGSDKYSNFDFGEYSHLKKESWDAWEWWNAIANMIGWLSPYRLKASEITATICDYYKNQNNNSEIHVCGESNGGATAQFAALDNGLPATIINSLPLGVGAQKYLHDQGKLTKANIEKITELSIQHDPLSYGRMFMIPDAIFLGSCNAGAWTVEFWLAFLRIFFDGLVNLFRNSARNYRGVTYVQQYYGCIGKAHGTGPGLDI